MAVRNLSPTQIRLNVPEFGLPLTMEMEQFFEFSFWMAEELLDLEREFEVWKTPASTPLEFFDANGLPEELDIDLSEI